MKKRAGFAVAAILSVLAGLGSSCGPEGRSTPAPADALHEPLTFAVFGDNRTRDWIPPGFERIIGQIRADAPALVINTGDIIYGDGAAEADQRAMWAAYRAAIKPLDMPVHHVPGNHDIFDPASGRVYREFAGEPRQTFDAGPCRFITLDVETTPGRIEDEQLAWLEAQLKAAKGKIPVVLLHRPPFKSGNWARLDLRAADGERLHALLVRHGVKTVFAGHEHQYGCVERDGVRYYITGGANPTLYAPPELGGFPHNLLARVHAGALDVQIKRLPSQERPAPPVAHAPGTMLDDFRAFGQSWHVWDNSVRKSLIDAPGRPHRKALKLTFDTGLCEFPTLYTMPEKPWNLRQSALLAATIYAPPEVAGATVTPGVEGAARHDAPPVTLQAGWNTVAASLQEKWLPPASAGAVRQIQWVLQTPGKKQAGWIALGDVHTTLLRKSPPQQIDAFHAPMLWNTWNERVFITADMGDGLPENRGLRWSWDAATCPTPMLYAPLDPPRDLRKLRALTVQARVPVEAAGARVRLVLGREFRWSLSPEVTLNAGEHALRFDLRAPWLAPATAASADHIRFELTPVPGKKAAVVLARLQVE